MNHSYKTIATIAAHRLGCIREDKILFENISFELTAGEVLLIEGPNGSGKSSLLRLLTGLATPYTGEIFWQNKLISSTRVEYSEQLHYIGHANGIKLGLTVAENLQLISYLSLTSLYHLDEVLSSLQLSTYKNTLVKNLSAGQKRRIALAKLFLLPKSLWILDEPFTALDAKTQETFLSNLENHLHQGGIAIISSHHPINLKHHTIQTMRLGT